MSELGQIIQTLKQPEYVHVLLNPLPVYGLACGVLVLGLSMILKSRQAQIISLILILLTAGSAWPVAEFGEKGYDRVYAMSYGDGQQWLHAHEERAEDFIWIFYVTAAVALAAMLLPWKFPRTKTPFLIGTMILAVASVVVGGWIGHAGGQVRHSEFRQGPPPVSGETSEH